MPMQFDPQWEYYCPDAEIQEVLQSSFRLEDGYFRENAKRMGLRCGRGNPDHRMPRKLQRVVERYHPPGLTIIPCRICGHLFRPKRKGQSVCSHRCLGRSRATSFSERVRKGSFFCSYCKNKFIPKRAGRDTYCSRQCSRLARPAEPLHHAEYQQFKVFLLEGWDLKALQEKLGVSLPTLRRWRRSLRVPHEEK